MPKVMFMADINSTTEPPKLALTAATALRLPSLIRLEQDGYWSTSSCASPMTSRSFGQFWTDQKSPAAEMICAEIIMMMRRVMMEENWKVVVSAYGHDQPKGSALRRTMS